MRDKATYRGVVRDRAREVKKEAAAVGTKLTLRQAIGHCLQAMKIKRRK